MSRRKVSFPGFDLTLLGDRKVAKRLSRLAPKVQKKAMSQSMRAAMKPVLKASRAAAPRRSGQKRKSDAKLARLIQLRKAKMKAKDGMAFQVRPPPRAKLGIPMEADGFYPAALEFGWTDRWGESHPARPYLRPALNKNRTHVKRKFGRELGVRIVKLAKGD